MKFEIFVKIKSDILVFEQVSYIGPWIMKNGKEFERNLFVKKLNENKISLDNLKQLLAEFKSSIENNNNNNNNNRQFMINFFIFLLKVDLIFLFYFI